MDLDLLEPSEAGKLWDVTPAQARKIGDLGKVPMIRTAAGRRLFRREDVEAEAQRRQANRAAAAEAGK